MNVSNDEKKVDWAEADAQSWENVVWVGPGSLKAQPPIESHVCKPGFSTFNAVNLAYRSCSLAASGTISKVLGSIDKNA
jgi:hypothetical protein